MEIRFRLQRTSLIWLACALISFCATLYLGYRFIAIQNNLLSQAQKNAHQETEDAARELNAFITMLKPIAQQVADEIGANQLSKEEIVQLIKEKKPAEITGLGVAFIPYAIDEQTKLFSPYYLEQDGKEQLINLANQYDYTAPEITWFTPVLKNGAQYIDPYYALGTKTIVAEYAVPIYAMKDGKKEAIGVVFANQSVEHLNHILNTLFLNQTGYWAMLSNKGTYLAHPQDQIIHKQITIFDLAEKLNNPDLAKAAKSILEKKEVFFEYENEITGAPSWLFSEPLEGTNWSILGIFDKSELTINTNSLRRNLIYPSLTAVLFMIFLTLFIFSLFSGDHAARWWIASAIVSFALSGQIMWVWHAAYRYPSFHEQKKYIVKNKADLYSFLKEKTTPYRYGIKQEKTTSHDTSKKATPTSGSLENKQDVLLYGYKNDRYIPTGIFINSLQFNAANQVAFSGYIWQRFTDGLHDDIPRGFTLPQSTEAKSNELSQIKEGDTVTILWEVHAVLDQLFYFDRYPFDTKALQIQIWHRYSKKNVVLVPDLDGYQLINPRALAGIDDDTHLPGWKIVATNFGYKQVNYTSNFGAYAVGPFGIYQEVDKSEVPELFYNIYVTRRLIDTLVSDLLPIAVIAVLLFVILLTSTQQKLAVIGSCASVFFATIFAQLRFRSKLPQAQIVYFESFFFLMYAMILVILIVTISHQLEFNIPFIRHRDNMISKLLYWPVLFASLAAITFGYLY